MLQQNANQTFTFSPSAGYAVSAVSVDGISAPLSAAYSFVNVTGNHTLRVTFAASAASVPDAGAGGAGAVEVAGAGGSAASSAGPSGSGQNGAGAAGLVQAGAPNIAPAEGDSAKCSCRLAGPPASVPAVWGVWCLLARLGVVSRFRARRC